MPQYFAFLRALNVGGRVIKMDRLAQLFEKLEFTQVETFIASGNVIFQSPNRTAAALEKKIAAHLKQELGYEVATFLRTGPELAAAAAHQPFPAKDAAAAHAIYVGFLPQAPTPAAWKKLQTLATANDSFQQRGKELWWLARQSVADSKLSGNVLEKNLGLPMTLRNVKTLQRLADKYLQERRT